MDGGIKFDVSANTAKFDADMARVGNVATRASDKVKQAFSGLGGLLAGGAIIGGMTGLLKKMDDISDGARRIGISAEEFQKIGNAAALVGTSVETVNKAMIRAGVAANKAAREGGDMAEAFARASLDPAKFAAAGLEERIKMVAEAQRAANGDARQMSELFEAIGVKAAGIDFSALAEEMGNVNAASSDTVEALARANDALDKAKQTAAVLGATLLKALVIDPAERLGSFLGGAGFKTIKELEEIELRANAIAELTRQGLFSGDDTQKAILIADKMEEIQNRLKGNKNITAGINEDLDTANKLEKEKTSELERQQRLLEQQEAKRKEAIKDSQFEVELIEAKLRGDKDRVAALEEQRDFEHTLEQTGSFEYAAKLAAAKAAERRARGNESLGGGGGGGGGFGFRPQDPTQDQTVAQMRADAARNRRMGRFDEFMAGNQFRSAARTSEAADRASNRILENQMRRDFMRDTFGASNLGEVRRNFERDARKAGMTADEALNRMGIDRATGQSREDALRKFIDEQALPPNVRDQRERGGQGRAGGGGGGGNQLEIEPAVKSAVEAIRKFVESINEKLPQHALVPG
jgi:hypothetical protein